jgi:hypothetical protein
MTPQLLQEQREQVCAAKAVSKKEYTKVSKELDLNAETDAFEGIPWFCSAQQAYNDWFHGEPEGAGKGHMYFLVQHGRSSGMFTLNQLLQAVSRFHHYKDAGSFNASKIFKPGFFKKGKPHKKLGKVLKLNGHDALVLALTLPAILWEL